jgi:uncharacterized glyoxalase superfamily protein PhnB
MEALMTENRFEGVTPILNVRDLAASVAWYTGVLGFEVDWQQPGIMASVSRDRCCIFLVEGGQGHPGTWMWIGVADAGALCDEVRAKGATIRMEPTNYTWAYEFHVEDPDSHILRLGSEPKEGQPFGPWKDMHGMLWEELPGGGWRRVE